MEKLFGDLFDQAVRHYQEPTDDLNNTLFEANRLACVVCYPERTREILQRAKVYAEKHKEVSV